MTYSPDERAAELARRDATSQYRPLTDESEAASGDGVVFADESEWADECEGGEEGSPSSVPTMTVRVADRRYSPVGHAMIRTVTIPAVCPQCGGPRGEPFNHNFGDDGEYLSCDRWNNPCGHVDYYDAVLAEAGL